MKNQVLTHPKDLFFDTMEAQGLSLTYDDLRLRTGHSNFMPNQANLTTQFSRNIGLKIPIASAAMDTVTEYEMAIAIAAEGGIGIIHKGRGMTPHVQALHVKRVKHWFNVKIDKPISVNQNDTVAEVLQMREEKKYKFQTFTVLDNDGKLVGLLTKNCFDLCTDNSLQVKAIMVKGENLITAPPETSVDEALEMMQKKDKGVLPLVDSKGRLAGMYIFSDIARSVKLSGTHNLDAKGHLIVGAAIGARLDDLERVSLLVDARVDVLVIDTAHADTENVFEMVRQIKKTHPLIDLVVGNISEPASAKRLVDLGVDGLKVGQGGGSICTTRIVAGIGCPQVTAVYECSRAIRGSGIPIIADGGIRNPGDIPIAIGVGASCVMLGKVLAGTTESPGDFREFKGDKFKVYRGMGSLSAMKDSTASRERYLQTDADPAKLVPEGIESLEPYKGDVGKYLQTFLGGLRAGMGYVGLPTIPELMMNATFRRISQAGLAESHPHDVIIAS